MTWGDVFARGAKSKPCYIVWNEQLLAQTSPVNADKTEYMCFNQGGDISTVNGSSLKLADKFTYLGSSVSSTKTNINTGIAKALSAIDRQLIIWKSDLTDKIKRIFFPTSGRVDIAIWMHYMDAN